MYTIVLIKSRVKILFMVLISTVILVGCGGGGDSSPLQVDENTAVVEDENTTVAEDENTEDTGVAPVFTSNSNVYVLEDQNSAITLQATDADADIVSYSLSGADASDFDINKSSGVVVFKLKPDYDFKNVYTFTATASDSKNLVTTQEVTINVIKLSNIKTGQTQSYDNNGNVVLDNSIKDDGFYKSGQPTKYTRDNESNIVIDHISKLMWQDGSISTVKTWLDDTTIQSGSDTMYDLCTENENEKCYDTSGDTAQSYCENLSFGSYSDWRLPSAKEFESIISDYTKVYPDSALDTNYFQSTNAEHYYFWTSTTLGVDITKAIIANTQNAKMEAIPKDNLDGYINSRVRCVRDMN
jgi:hypothetical protein